MKRITLLVSIVFIVNLCFAQVRLPNIFGDNMVLQREQPIAIWGWSSPRERITVTLDNQSKRVTAGKDGKWKVAMDAMPASGPFQLTVKGKNTLTFNNVLIGEVWICSGQSNMEWPVKSSNNAEAEIANGNYPVIRHIKIPNTVAAEPKDDIGEASWEICSLETVGDFTAVGYFFARELTKELNVPIGLINTSWGGTHVETWTSREAFDGSEEFRSMIASVGKIDLESIGRKNEEAMLKKIESLQGSLTKNAEEVEQWKALSFDDSSWPKMNIPGLWEQQGLSSVDGFVWLRKSFTLDADGAGKGAVLSLAKIDDADDTFVNGVRVGGVRNYSAERSYTIAPGILKQGENVIAVRVEDTGGGGGIYGEPDDVKISLSGKDHWLAGEWTFQVESLLKGNTGVGPNQFPTLLFNAMINPLIPYTIRGALWYQGESNAGRAYQYRTAFPLMINDWRQRWGQGDFPFYFAQLASFNADNGNSAKGSAWAELREAQTLTLSLPNTGMAVTTDIGEADDIHPRNKQEVGLRLSAIALDDIFEKDIVSRGPSYESMTKEGNQIILTFTDTGSGLMARDKYGYLKGFEIAGADKKFHYAKAHIDGNTVVVYHDSLTEPVGVRYGWADDAGECNLFNKEGFPAGPFRTDDWKGVTEEAKFWSGQ